MVRAACRCVSTGVQVRTKWIQFNLLENILKIPGDPCVEAIFCYSIASKIKLVKPIWLHHNSPAFRAAKFQTVSDWKFHLEKSSKANWLVHRLGFHYSIADSICSDYNADSPNFRKFSNPKIDSSRFHFEVQNLKVGDRKAGHSVMPNNLLGVIRRLSDRRFEGWKVQPRTFQLRISSKEKLSCQRRWRDGTRDSLPESFC